MITQPVAKTVELESGNMGKFSLDRQRTFFYLKNSIESMFYFIGQGKANFCFSSERAGQVLSKAALLIRFLAKLKFSGFKG